MALIRCPDCTREVSSRARSCPQCAYPIENLTNLSEAIEQNDIDLLRDMLRAGLDPNKINKEGFSPLMVSVDKGNLTATKILVEHGADLSLAGPTGTTALQIAESRGHEAIAGYLLENGADDSFDKGDSETVEQVEESPVSLELKEEVTVTPALEVVKPEAVQPPPVPRELKVEPPPLPKHEQSRKQNVRFIDDTLPYIEDEKHTGPGLICRMCKEQIAAEDIWCANCKAPIIRRYCGGCRELIPDNAAHCPYCSSSKVHRFRYIRHMEQFVAGSAILAVLLFIFSLYGPDDGSSYAQKLAEKRSEQQEAVEDAAEQQSKQLHRQRAEDKAAPTQRAVRVIPRESSTEELTHAEGKTQHRIPTVERIEAASQGEQPAENERKIAQIQPEDKNVPPQTSEEREAPAPEENRSESNPSSDSAARPAAPEPEERGSVEIGRRLNAHGFRLMKKGRYAEAIPVLAQSVRSFPPGHKDLTYAYAMYNLGRSLRLVGRPDLAIPILEERMKFADQRHIVARELEMARSELNGGEPVNKVEFE